VKITFLGTGTSQGVPIIACKCYVCSSKNAKDKRLRTSILIEHLEKTIVVDTGPDFRQQMLRAHVQQLDAVLYTHEHKDHIAGMDDIRAFNYILQKKIPLYGGQYVHEAIKREFAYIFADYKYPGIPEIDLILVENKPFQIEQLDFIPIEVKHLKLPVYGYRINNFTYITDANYIAPEEKEKMKGSDVLVINALRKEEHVSHFNLAQALEIIDELKPKMAYLTHLSHQMGRHDEVEKELPEGVKLAYDGLVLDI